MFEEIENNGTRLVPLRTMSDCILNTKAAVYYGDKKKRTD